MFPNPGPCPPFNLCRQCWFRAPQSFHPFVQPKRIQLIDGKGPMATLRAPNSANQPLAGPLSRIGQRRSHNLH
jgi:hypothetical protein